jgi:hypothetical protein
VVKSPGQRNCSSITFAPSSGNEEHY